MPNQNKSPEYYPGALDMLKQFSAGARGYDAMFTRVYDGQDVRKLPKVKHPKSGLLCFDWGPGRWPQDMIDE